MKPIHLLAGVLLLASTAVAHAEDGNGPMVVEWHMVETLEEIGAMCGFETLVEGCRMDKPGGGHIIVTLPPRSFKDHSRFLVVMHELSHVKLGCFHDANGRYIGPSKDPEICRWRAVK